MIWTLPVHDRWSRRFAGAVYRNGTAAGLTAAGSDDSPHRWASTAAAADRPSAMAQTISDCPRPISPATNTPGTEAANPLFLATLPRLSKATPSPWVSGPDSAP